MGYEFLEGEVCALSEEIFREEPLAAPAALKVMELARHSKDRVSKNGEMEHSLLGQRHSAFREELIDFTLAQVLCRRVVIALVLDPRGARTRKVK